MCQALCQALKPQKSIRHGPCSLETDFQSLQLIAVGAKIEDICKEWVFNYALVVRKEFREA